MKRRLFVLAILVLAMVVVISFAIPRVTAGHQEEAWAELPHTAEEILLRQQSAKLQQGGEECAPAPPEYAEKAALIERARAFARQLGVWSDDMYKCYDPEPKTSLQIYFLAWYLHTAVAESRSLMGWVSAEFRPAPESLYINVRRKDVGGWVVSSIPDMNEEGMNELRAQLVRDNYALYGRWLITSTKKELREELLRMPANEIVESLLHEGCHDFFASNGMAEIRSLPELEEPLCTVYGFRGGMMFLAAEGQTEERQALEGRYRWSLKRAMLFNRLWWQLAVAFDGSFSEEERVARREEIFGRLTADDLQYLGSVPPNTAIVSSMRTYTMFLLAAEELWRILTGDPPIDMNPPLAENIAGTA